MSVTIYLKTYSHILNPFAPNAACEQFVRLYIYLYIILYICYICILYLDMKPNEKGLLTLIGMFQLMNKEVKKFQINLERIVEIGEYVDLANSLANNF